MKSYNNPTSQKTSRIFPRDSRSEGPTLLSLLTRTRPPETRMLLNVQSRLQLYKEPLTCALFYIAAMNRPNTQVAEINLQPSRARNYSAYIPVQLGQLTTAAFIDSGNTFANVISPQRMTVLGISISQLEPVPQLSIGTTAVGKRMKILGQAPPIDLQLGQHPAKFRIRPLVLQGLVHPVNICGLFLQRACVDQIHS